MRIIDELHLEFPFMGILQLSRHLLNRSRKLLAHREALHAEDVTQ
jgi:hypothetical protein